MFSQYLEKNMLPANLNQVEPKIMQRKIRVEYRKRFQGLCPVRPTESAGKTEIIGKKLSCQIDPFALPANPTPM
jgi:hypothetical protein